MKPEPLADYGRGIPELGDGYRSPWETIDAAEEKQRRQEECFFLVTNALAPLLRRYGSVMAHKAVQDWLREGA